MSPADALSAVVFAAVLAAAAMHAGWNAVLKLRLEPFLGLVLINGAAGLAAVPVLIVTGWPRAAAWPWLIGSVILHLGYYIGLTEAYRRADMGQIYPIARGSAPLITAIASLVFLAEPIGLVSGVGIAILGAGIATMSLRGGAARAVGEPAALAYAAFTAFTISGYTLVDGLGARTAGDAHAYAAGLFVVDGLFFTAFALFRLGLAGLKPVLTFALPGMAGGAMAFASYWTAIWAMTVAPIALVAAVRETSVLFAAAISVLILREPLRPNRVAAVGLILAGLVVLRLG